MENKANTVANKLTEHYNWNKFSFGAEPHTPLWRWRYLTSCVIVGGNNEADTLRCDEKLFAEYPTADDLAKADWKPLADMIESFGLEYSGKKAEYIINIAQYVADKGDIPNNREDLERLPGVGRHVASVILATCYDQNEFAVDVHVRRIAKRLGLVGEKASDLAVEKAIVAIVPSEKLGHFSRSFVDFGQTICGFSPKCGSCMLTQDCNSVNEKALKRVGIKVEIGDGVYTLRSHTIQVNNGYAKCDCTAGKFGRNCRHVKEIANGN